MAQINLRDRDAATYIGTESTYGTTPTTYRCMPLAGTVDFDYSKTEHENSDERARLYQRLANVTTLKKWTGKLSHRLKPDLVQLTGAGSPTTTLPCGILLKNAFGIEQAAAGTTVASAASGTAVTATSGTNIAIGTWQIFNAGSNTYVPCPVVNKATNDLTLGLTVGASPANGSIINNMYNYVPDPDLTNSITIQHAKAGDSNYQWTWNGGRVSEFGLSFPRGDMVQMDLSFEGSTWTGPTSQSLVTTPPTELEGVPFSGINGAIVLLQASSATTRTAYRLYSVSYQFQVGTILLPEYGGVEGVGSNFRNGPDNRTFVTATVRIYADTEMDTNWSTPVNLRFAILVPYGTTTTKRWLVADMPTCQSIRTPRVVKENNMVLYELTLAAFENSTTTTSGLSGTNLKIATAPFILAMG